jgi:hypothetical protein
MVSSAKAGVELPWGPLVRGEEVRDCIIIFGSNIRDQANQ